VPTFTTQLAAADEICESNVIFAGPENFAASNRKNRTLALQLLKVLRTTRNSVIRLKVGANLRTDRLLRN